MKLVFLHALPLDGRMWRAEADVRPTNTLTPTLYGFGPALEDWGTGVLDMVGDEPLVLVGCSIGGSCALEIAFAAPEQVLGIVMVGAKPGVRPDPAVRDEAVHVLETGGMTAAWPAYWEPLFGPHTSQETLNAARSIAFEQSIAQVVQGVRAFHDRRDLSEFAHSWRRPIVSVSGAYDRTPRRSAASMASGPTRRFHFVEDSGHYVSLEQPAAFRALLTQAVEWILTPATG